MDEKTIKERDAELPYTDIQLSKKAIHELKIVLKNDIGIDALLNLTEKEIHHIGVMMLTLTSIQLKIKMRELKKT